ncbi:MAG: crotonase/enoyl-CoA hydratase family protein [Pseudomonadota bacterium]|nr:crotonase/enoyl-CoA hydratase family protein [Pseudomonadota bacterium]
MKTLSTNAPVSNELRFPRSPYVRVQYDREHQLVWASMGHPERPCMTPELIRELTRVQKTIEDRARSELERERPDRLLFQVLASDLPGVFNLGGDLAHFLDVIRRRDRATLYEYAKACIDTLYPSSIAYGLPFTTISLVQGQALGGGFEAALCGNVLIAERQATFGFPESLFGMFPGMGAYSFLARRLSPGQAKRIITSGKVYAAEELYELGLIDVLAPDGEGRRAVLDYVKQQNYRIAGHHGFQQAIDRVHPISYEELLDITNIWVDTAMQLTDTNLRRMEYLLRAQERRWGGQPLPQVAQQLAG